MANEAQPLTGLRVLDIATLFAGPLAATMLGDFGADVIKVEHPRGDPARTHGPSKAGVPLWWKMLSRNKRAVTLNLSTIEGQDIFRQLAKTADVTIENFRPGTLERWGLGYDVLKGDNPRLVLARVTAFGQFGPLSRRPGFGTIAEAMSGFAAITGSPDGPPTLPPFGLADGIAGLTTAFAIMTALSARERTGVGQVIDMAIIEPILSILGPQPIIYDQLGVIQQRMGNRTTNNAPRNTYKTADGHWLAVSTSSLSVAVRVMQLVGHPEVTNEEWFSSGEGRAGHSDELDAMVAQWISARNSEEVLAAFEAADAAIAPVYTVADVMADPQYEALDSVTRVNDPDLGEVRMQNVLFRMSSTPGSIRWTGPGLGEHNAEVYSALGISPDAMTALREKNVL
jgi:formyl-CoA transferase